MYMCIYSYVDILRIHYPARKVELARALDFVTGAAWRNAAENAAAERTRRAGARGKSPGGAGVARVPPSPLGGHAMNTHGLQRNYMQSKPSDKKWHKNKDIQA